MICLALLHLPEQGLIHRDVKPDNIFLSDPNLLKLGDFGLSRRFDPQRKTLMLTKFGGTPLYRAPEQLKIDKAK